MDIGPSYLDFSISSSLFMLLTMVEKRGLKLPCISFSDAVQNRNYSADVIHPSFATERRFVRVILPAFLRNANFGSETGFIKGLYPGKRSTKGISESFLPFASMTVFHGKGWTNLNLDIGLQSTCGLPWWTDTEDCKPVWPNWLGYCWAKEIFTSLGWQEHALSTEGAGRLDSSERLLLSS